MLRDGTSAHVRPIVPGDAPALQDFHVAQSEQSRYFRFFTAKPTLSAEELDRLTRVDYTDRLALVALLDHRIVGVGRYTRTAPHAAEVAFTVADAIQGRGLGTILFDHLAAAARERGITTFTADVLDHNTSMLGVFEAAGYDLTTRRKDGVVAVEADTHVTARVRQVLEERERAAEAHAIELMMDPASIMIVGASRQRDHVGAQIVRGLLASGYAGSIFPVNPEAYEVNGLKTYSAIADVPGPVDLAVLAVNAERCVAALDELAAKGVKAIVVVSGGFAEAGPEGRRLQDALVAGARLHGMRLLGPASLGFFRTGERPLNVSLSPRTSERGTIALAGQSTALCAMVLAGADARGLRVREFLSAGNRADVSLNDALQHWEGNEEIDLVALSLESMGNPRKFTRLVRRLSARIPVVVVRPPNTDDIGPVDKLGEESDLPRHAMDQVLDAAGAIRASSVDHLLDIVSVLSREGRARGTRVGLLSNSGALGATLRAAAEESGLTVSAQNFRVPIVGDDRFVSRAFTSMAGPGAVDAVIVAILDTRRVDLVHLADELATLARGAAVQVLMVVVTDEARLHTLTEALRESPHLPPVFSTPDRATAALSSALASVAVSGSPGHRAQHPDAPPPMAPAGAADTVRGILERVGTGQMHRLERADLEALLGAYGIDLVAAHTASSIPEALAAARDLGYPVAVSLADSLLRAEPGQRVVHTDIASENQLSHSAQWLVDDARRRAPGGTSRPLTLLVQKMAPGGLPVIVRGLEDPALGPVVAFSLAGDATDIFHDIGYAIPPLDEKAARRLIATPRSAVALHRSAPERSPGYGALVALVQRLGELTDAHPECADITLGPILVSPSGLSVLDAAGTVGPAPNRMDSMRRTLPTHHRAERGSRHA